jgi:G6PDH family F420-dependent oxidoreductase
MLEIGFALSSEEHGGRELVRQAIAAERAGFDFVGISDHYHPWIDNQGQSPFVWSVLGAIASATERVQAGTMVTCPIMRVHPAVIAQAAATVAELMPGRFFLGLGSGENLNEHIVGQGWPPAHLRIAMLEEATDIIRRLWADGNVSYEGDYFTVDNARVYTLPESLPPIYMAASGPVAASLAGRAGDGLISTSANRELVEAFQGAGNQGPRLGARHLPGRDGAGGVGDGAPDLAQLRLPRFLRAGATAARPLRAGRHERDAGADRSGDHL